MLLIKFIIGTLLGSFLCAWQMRTASGSTIYSPARSQCTSCGHTLAWFELVPIISFLVLVGRCRHCHTRIPISTLLCECFAGAACLSWQPTWASSLNVVVLLLLLIMSLEDTTYFLIHHYWFWLLMCLAVALHLQTSPITFGLTLILAVWLVLQFLPQLSPYLGMGDLDIFLSLLIMTGILNFAWHLLISASLALTVSLLQHKRKLPFVPFIAISHLIISLYV